MTAIPALLLCGLTWLMRFSADGQQAEITSFIYILSYQFVHLQRIEEENRRLLEETMRMKEYAEQMKRDKELEEARISQLQEREEQLRNYQVGVAYRGLGRISLLSVS